MDMNKIRPASDAVWYCRKDAEEERFYEIFFQLCRKYSVRWASATPKEKSFIEEAGQGAAAWFAAVGGAPLVRVLKVA